MNLLIGSNNQAKIERWSNCFPDYDIVSPRDRDVHIMIAEGTSSLIKNSQDKALAYAKASGLITLSDDTGFFMKALRGAPGIAVRRWGGKLPDNISDEEWFQFFKAQIRDIKDTRAYFEYAVSIALPTGQVQTATDRSYGFIDTTRMDKQGMSMGYPLGSVFVREGNDKPWDEMNQTERTESSAGLIAKVTVILNQLSPLLS